MSHAPSLLVHGKIYTLDPVRPLVPAVLLTAGRLTHLGTLSDCRDLAPPGTQEIALGKGCAVPGLVEAHGHLLWFGRALQELDCSPYPDELACAQAARAHALTLSPEQWVRGRGWDQNRWPEQRFPTEKTLSEAVPNRPVLLERVDGHAWWLNAQALAACHITAQTEDPPGGKLLRYPDGQPTGVLLDNAQQLFLPHLPVPSAAELERTLCLGMQKLTSYGLTAVHDAGVLGSWLRVYQQLAEADRLPLRVYAMLDAWVPPWAEVLEQMQRWGARRSEGRLTVRAVKLFADGALGSRGALLHEPYADEPQTLGLWVTPPEQLTERISLVARAGFQPAVHAIGDGACTHVIRSFYAAQQSFDMRSVRPRLEHAQLLCPEDLPKLAASGAVASMQPLHATSDAGWIAQRLGPSSARLQYAYAWRSVLEAGVPLAFGSDVPIESPDPRAGLYAAETRCAPGQGGPFLPDQRLSRMQALQAYTQGPAFASFAESCRGILRAGFQADLTLFAEDLFAVGPQELLQLPLTHTIVGGRIEFQQDP